VILAGRRINDGMGSFVARKTAQLLAEAGIAIEGARIGVLGLTFKPNVADLRRSQVGVLIAELRALGATTLVHDPLADAGEALRVHGVELQPRDALAGLDALILAVPHREYVEQSAEHLVRGLREGGVVVDVWSAIDPSTRTDAHRHWSV
jgi:UDP-N-acetyl-D-galactosamine dehydrogenase